MYKILTIDGGGIRGIIPAMVLAELERRTGKRVHEMFDLIAGTSTGGILACGLTVPDATGKAKYSASDLYSLYNDKCTDIFKARSKWKTLWGVLNESFDHTNLEQLLQAYFGQTTLSQALTHLLVPAFDVMRNKPFYFNSRLAQAASEDVPLWKVARATSAAPTYFEPYALDWQGGTSLIDGGVFANNPAVLALAEGQNVLRQRKAQLAALQTASTRAVAAVDVAPVAEQEVMIVSLGTGYHDRAYLHQQAVKWGVAGWGRPLINIFFSSGSDSADFIMQHLAPNALNGARSYYRLNPRLQGACGIADTSKLALNELRNIAERLIYENEAQLKEIMGVLA